MKISASIYSNKHQPLADVVRELDEHFIDFFHVDCNDDPSVFKDIVAIHQSSSTPVDLGQPAIDLVAGMGHTCALLMDGSVKCWGANNNGELATGDTDLRLTPVAIDLPAAVRTLGTSQGARTCVILMDDSAVCWGLNNSGALGVGDRDPRLTVPEPIVFDSVPIAIGTGWQFTCALLSNGNVHCWGSNQSNALGDGLGLYWSPAEEGIDLRGRGVFP